MSAESKLTADDRFEITNVINLYIHCLDNGDSEGFAKLFTPDAICEVLSVCQILAELVFPGHFDQTSVQGTEKLKAFCVNLHTKFADVTHWYRLVSFAS